LTKRYQKRTVCRVPKKKHPLAGIRFGGADMSALYQLAPGELLPRRFCLGMDIPDLPYTVEIDVGTEPGRIWCVALRAAARDDGPAVTSEGLRKLPVARLLKIASQFVAELVYTFPEGALRMSLQEPSLGALVEAQREIAVAVRQRNALTPRFFEEVARVWHDAENPRARTRAVAAHFHTVPQNARKWVRAARKLGLIPEEER